MDDIFTCKVYGVYAPSSKDRIFYYSGEIRELRGVSLEDIQSQYEAIELNQPGTIPAEAYVFFGKKCVGIVSASGYRQAETSWAADFAKAKEIAIANALKLNVENETMRAIQKGNIHEVTFFADPRVCDWLSGWKCGEQISMFDFRFESNA